MLPNVAFVLVIGCAPTGGKGASSLRAHDHHHDNEAPVIIGEEEQRAYERARPVFERYCAACHTRASGNSAALGHFVMDIYPFGGHHEAQIAATIRRVLGATGERPTMPVGQPGAVRDAELRFILDWAAAFDRARLPAAGKQTGHHEH